MSQLGLGTSEADLAKYPLFSPILGGISKLFKIHINRIGSKSTCGLEDPYTKPEKIFSSNGAFLANFRSNQFSRLANFSWARTFKNLKNSKIKNFLQFFPNKLFPGKSALKSPKNALNARLEARNSSIWAFRKIDDFWPKSEICQNRDFRTPQFWRQSISGSQKDTHQHLEATLVHKQNLSLGRLPKGPFWDVP